MNSGLKNRVIIRFPFVDWSVSFCNHLSHTNWFTILLSLLSVSLLVERRCRELASKPITLRDQCMVAQIELEWINYYVCSSVPVVLHRIASLLCRPAVCGLHSCQPVDISVRLVQNVDGAISINSLTSDNRSPCPVELNNRFAYRSDLISFHFSRDIW